MFLGPHLCGPFYCLYILVLMKLIFKSKIEHLDKLMLNHITVTTNQLKKTFNDQKDASLYNQRFIIRINNKVSWRGGSVALSGGKAYITFSKQRMKEAEVDLGDLVTVELEKDHSEYGFDVPQEWIVAIEQDPLAKERFDELTMGRRRSIIYLVIQFKTVEKRIDKILFFLENLKRSPRGKTTMRHILGKDL